MTDRRPRANNIYIAMSDEELARVRSTAASFGMSMSGFARCVLHGAMGKGGATLDGVVELGEELTKAAIPGSKNIHRRIHKPAGINYYKVFTAELFPSGTPMYRRVYAEDERWVIEKAGPAWISTRVHASKDPAMWWWLRERSPDGDLAANRYLYAHECHDPEETMTLRRAILHGLSMQPLAFDRNGAMVKAHQIILERKANGTIPHGESPPTSDVVGTG